MIEDPIFTTLDRIRETAPTHSNLADLINAVAFVCSQVRGMDVSLVQDLLDEAYQAMDGVYAYSDEERHEHARELA